MIEEYLRLAFGTLVVLLPGRLVARSLGQRTTSASLAWTLAALFVSWALVFIVHGTIYLQLVVFLAIGASTFLVGVRHGDWEVPKRQWQYVLAGGVLLGIALWRVAPPVSGDGLFHEGRVRKLVDLGNLHLRSVDELAKGGLHPGYAFPLWHGFLADVAKLSGLDPGVVVQHEASLLVPIACLVAWESGVAVFGTGMAGFGVLAASLALYCFAAGHGGAYVSLALPATAARQLLVPAVIALFFGYVVARRLVDLIALSLILGELALIHSSYALFVLLPLAAYAAVRYREWRRNLTALVAGLVPVGLVLLWTRPLVMETLSVNPGATTLKASLKHYGGELVVSSTHRYRLSAQIFSRTGSVAVAALLLVPVAGIAARKRWGAFVLGGSIVILALSLIPFLFVHFSHLVSISQARRQAGFIPLQFAFGGGLALLARSIFVLPLALVTGIVFQLAWPGDFAYGLAGGGPGVAAWFALGGGVIALIWGLRPARRRPFERWDRGAVAAALFILPVVVYGARHWTPPKPIGQYELTPALARELKRVPAQAVIIGPLRTSYVMVAKAPVYVVAAPPTHVAATEANQPYLRRREVDAWLQGKAPSIPRKYGATWAVDRKGRLYPLRK